MSTSAKSKHYVGISKAGAQSNILSELALTSEFKLEQIYSWTEAQASGRAKINFDVSLTFELERDKWSNSHSSRLSGKESTALAR